MSRKSAREYHLLRKYGLTLEEYENLLVRQGNGCAVCHRPASDFKVRLAVDHDHKTGEIYGLLCYHCNHRLIGRIRDYRLFENAAKYLKKGTGHFVPKLTVHRRRRARRKGKKRST